MKTFFVRGSGRVASVSLAALLMVTAAVAEEAAPEMSEAAVTAASTPMAVAPADQIIEQIVVTGSRIAKDTYSSISPLQVVTAEASREAGLIDAGTILQSTSAAAGLQIDLTLGGFVLDNGPGASTIDLRGLGANRTLVLLNGRRLAPAGVEGAPVSPDLNLIPSMLVRQYDLLLDGASSIYGSDAVAGVTNVLLRTDFEGFEFSAYSSNPEASSGASQTFSAAWGVDTEGGFFGAGLEYQKTDGVTLDERRWTKGCERHVEIDENGKRRAQDLRYPATLGMAWDDCNLGGLVGRVFAPLATGSVYYTPGSSNGGWGRFSETTDPYSGLGVDGNGDGRTDLTFRDYSLNGRAQNQSLFPDTDRFSIMAYGEHTFDGRTNLTPYFEALYSERSYNANTGTAQLFPDVPAANPYNLCNPDAIGGVDCGLAEDALLTNPNYVNRFRDFFVSGFDCFGVPAEFCTPETFELLNGPIGAIGTQPIVAVRGDRSSTRAQVSQYRLVTGLRGDLPMLDIGPLTDWSYDAHFSYSKSEGDSSRPGIRGDRLDWSLANSVRVGTTNSVTCPTMPGDTKACIPINMFAESLYQGVVGDFGTAAERNYLFDSRDFKTDIEQAIVSAFMSGGLFELPYGTVLGSFGVEYREDQIKSIPDDIARDGLFFGFFSDGGATGEKWTKEAFAEIELPLLAEMPLINQLDLNLSTRYTDDEYYGSDTTYSAKLGYRPVDPLLVRATWGTSFRAPNLRENFLQNQTGFGNVFDPCAIPEAAIDRTPGGSGYNPALDPRAPEVLANCLATGVDPRAFNNNGFNTYSVEIAQGGALDLNPETSESYTLGFAFDQPFFDSFAMTVGATYYNIEIENSIVEPSSQYIVNDCYTDAQGNSPFCSRINRNASGFLSFLDASFINRNAEVARGVDVNLSFAKDDFVVFGRPLIVGFDLNFNRNLEASITEIDENDVKTTEEFTRDFGFPAWKGRTALRFAMADYRFNWQMSYIGKARQPRADVDAFSDISGTADTCLGPPTDVLCRDVGFADDYMIHSVSLFYDQPTWSLGAGVRNLFDRSPPRVDGSEILSINNTPIGYGYDLNGRTFFLDLTGKL
jgi:iron complex outermembrane recepter protein